MEPEKSTTSSSEPLAPNGRVALPDFELPEGDPFEGRPPQRSLEELNRRCQELRRWFPNSIPTAEERWSRKIPVEFNF